jgi:hypothetical protein
MTSTATNEDWLGLIQAEYQEVPGLRLTMPQVRRLWGLDDSRSRDLLDVLVERRILKVTRDKMYMRADMGA